MRNRRTVHGMTLVEMLLALSLSAALCAAVSAAFKASADAVALNQAYFRCTQTARAAMTQIVADLRRADAVKLDASCRRVLIIRPAAELTDGEVYREYAYDPAAGRITLQIFFIGEVAGPAVEIADHITACTIGPADPRTSPDTLSQSVAVRIPIALTCKIGTSQVTLNGAASPRRAGF